jgi:hypothetical protein
MDEFMRFMNIDGWNRSAYDDAANIRRVEARWIPQNALLEISHAVRKNCALTCKGCHTTGGIMDFKALGYDAEEIESLQQPRY